jgi:hypothetical protein
MKYALAALELAVGVTLAGGLIITAWRLYQDKYHWLYWYAVSFVLFVVFFGTGMLVSWLLGNPTIQLLRSL